MSTHLSLSRPDAQTSRARSLLDALVLRRREWILPAILLAEIILWSVIAPSFFTATNLINILRASSTVGIMAVGMTFVILTAGIDLSVGSLVSLAGMVAATTLAVTGSSLVVVLATLLVGVLVGLLNGGFVAKLNVPPLIATLGAMYILTAGSQLWNNGGPLPLRDPLIMWLGAGYIGPIPVPVLVFALILFGGYWVLNQTRFGRHIYAVGGNIDAARLSGIHVDRVLIGVYVVSGVMAAVASLLYAGRLATASPLTGTGLELQVIASVVVGGASLFGGRGTLRDTTIGVFILTILQTGLNLIGVSGFWQTMALGIALLIAVLLSPESSVQKIFRSLTTSRKAAR